MVAASVTAGLEMPSMNPKWLRGTVPDGRAGLV